MKERGIFNRCLWVWRGREKCVGAEQEDKNEEDVGLGGIKKGKKKAKCVRVVKLVREKRSVRGGLRRWKERGIFDLCGLARHREEK